MELRPKYRLRRDHQFHLSTDGKTTLCGLSGPAFKVAGSDHCGPCNCRKCRRELGKQVLEVNDGKRKEG